MKILIPIIFLIIGLALGWGYGRKVVKEDIEEMFPAEAKESLKVAYEYIGDLSKEEIRETMSLIARHSEQGLQEMELMYFWQAKASYNILKSLEENGPEAAKKISNRYMDMFYSSYDPEQSTGMIAEHEKQLQKNIKEMRTNQER